MKIILTITSTDLVTKSLLSSFFLKLQSKKESGFQQIGGLVTRKISVFCLYQVTPYFKALPNSIDFYKGIFLHIIHVRIIVTWIKKVWR